MSTIDPNSTATLNKILEKIGVKSIFELKEITYLGFTSVLLNIFKIRKRINQKERRHHRN